MTEPLTSAAPARRAPRPSIDAPENGLIDEAMIRVLGRSWRTTLTGLLVILCSVAMVVPGVPHVVTEVCKVLLPIVTGTGLLIAKDGRVSGTDSAVLAASSGHPAQSAEPRESDDEDPHA
jgi:hypothetical protein